MVHIRENETLVFGQRQHPLALGVAQKFSLGIQELQGVPLAGVCLLYTSGKLAEKCLVAADITTNKNMVPFDSRSPFQTSGLRFGTPAITTRGLKEDKMEEIVALIDRVLSDPENEANIAAVRKEVNAMMANYPLFAW